jgi:hypothetical protein
MEPRARWLVSVTWALIVFICLAFVDVLRCLYERSVSDESQAKSARRQTNV